MTKLFRRNNSKKVGFLIVLATSFHTWVSADSNFEYFGSKIDYWNANTGKKSVETKGHSMGALPQSENNPASDGFPWKTYLDPKNKEFFKEGDYTPPEPFMEIVRNPTDANLKLWFAYIDKKNELAQKLQEKMQEYIEKNSVSLGDAGRTSLNTKLASLPRSEPNAKRFRFRMYFDSHCPHCRKMFETLQALQAKGFFVEAKQVDSDSRGIEGLGISITRATAEEIRQRDIQSVPVLLIGDLETKTVYRLTGYQSVADIFSALRQPSIPMGGNAMN